MTTTPPEVRPRERFSGLLLPLALAAYGAALLALLGGFAGVLGAIAAASSDAPVRAALAVRTDLPAAPGTHEYSGGPYVADGAQVVVTGVDADVSGLDAVTRVALQLGPALSALTGALVLAAVGLGLARIRRRDAARPASRPLLVAAAALAIGTVVAQAITLGGRARLGHVSWIGPGGLDGFTGTVGATFDLTPLVGALGLLVVVLVLRRSEPLRE